MSKPYSRINAKDLPRFVEVWQVAPDLETVSKEMGVDRLDCSAVASHLRKKGVPLKKFQTYATGVDYTSLALIAARASS